MLDYQTSDYQRVPAEKSTDRSEPGFYTYYILESASSPGIIEFHEVLGFWDVYGILGFKVKMHHFEQPARRRVVRKSVECCDFC